MGVFLQIHRTTFYNNIKNVTGPVSYPQARGGLASDRTEANGHDHYGPAAPR